MAFCAGVVGALLQRLAVPISRDGTIPRTSVACSFEQNGDATLDVQVAGDKKTPAEAKPFCENSAKEFGVECIYQTVDDQIAWVGRDPFPIPL
eukprot:1034879-Rhodomonas_salina.2